MLRFIENRDAESEVAYFVSFHSAAPEALPSQAEIDELYDVVDLVGSEEARTHVDFTVGLLTEGIVRRVHQHLLREYIDSLDPPILEAFLDKLFLEEDEGRIGQKQVGDIFNIATLNWEDTEVYNREGVMCDPDPEGNPEPMVFDLDAKDQREQEVARSMGLNAKTYQVEIDWSGNRPTLGNSDNGAPLLYDVLGTIDESWTYTPVTRI